MKVCFDDRTHKDIDIDREIYQTGFWPEGDFDVIKAELAAVEKAFLTHRPEIEEFHVGDTVDVHVKIKEGDRERVQVFNGVVLTRSGRGANEMFTVRRIVNEEGVERSWPLLCPSISKVAVRRHGKVRRAKLYYLRDRKGKATKVRELRSAMAEDAAKSAE
jgi:large subunit ribosomal protein L19